MNKITSLLNSLSSIVTDQKQINEKTGDKLSVLQYIKRFAASTYYGIRQWLLQVTIFNILCKIAIWLGGDINFGRFGLEGLIMILCMLLYTMLYYWFKALTPRLLPLRQIIIPYILYAVMVYLEIVSENDWNFKRVTFDYYMQLGLFMPLYSLAIIGAEYRLKTLIPDKGKRVVSIVWNVLTVLSLTFIVIGIIGFHLMLKG